MLASCRGLSERPVTESWLAVCAPAKLLDQQHFVLEEATTIVAMENMLMAPKRKDLAAIKEFD
jgi:hypothetical protein